MIRRSPANGWSCSNKSSRPSPALHCSTNSASTPFADLILRAVEPAARSFAVTARASACRNDADIDALMKHARDERGGVLVMPEVFTTVHRDAIVAAAARHRVPAVYPD